MSTEPTDKHNIAPSLFDDFLQQDAPKETEPAQEDKPEIIFPPSAQTTLVDETDSASSVIPKLPAEAKRALVNLIRTGSILASQKPRLFESLCRHEKFIRAHLDNMYLNLMLDSKAGVALVLQQDNDDEAEEDQEVYSLITRRTLSLYDTLLLLVLRKYYQEREASGDRRIVIDVEQIEAYLTPFLALSNSAKSDRRKLSGALTRMNDRKIISAVRGEDERFEITPVIRYVVSAEFLEHLLTEYTQLASARGTQATPTGIDNDNS